MRPPTIGALEGILIRSEENRLILTAYDLEIGMQTELPAIISAPGAIILTAKLFAEIVRRSPDEDITIDVDDRNTATITSGVSCFTIIGMDSAEFPELPKITDADTIKMPQELLKSMIRQTLFAVADSTAKPIHQGSLFKIESGNLDVVSVDGYRLALRREAINYANNTEFVVPGKTLSEVLKLLKDSEGEVEICPSRRHILFRIDNYTVISALLEGIVAHGLIAGPVVFRAVYLGVVQGCIDPAVDHLRRLCAEVQYHLAHHVRLLHPERQPREVCQRLHLFAGVEAADTGVEP